jgi:hypothetical protein
LEFTVSGWLAATIERRATVDKKKAIWLLIRLAGLWFILQLIENTVALISSYYIANSTPGLLAKSTGVLLATILRMVLYLILGLYCLGGGQALFNLLNRESDEVNLDDVNSDDTTTNDHTIFSLNERQDNPQR